MKVFSLLKVKDFFKFKYKGEDNVNIKESNVSFGSLSKREITNKIILHHPECNGWTIERVHDLHKRQFKWSGIGYHFYVRKDGSIYRGRPEWSIGAHCPGQNAVSISVCLEGNYMVDNMPEEQFNATMELVSYLKNKYGIIEIGGHRDYYSTDCPGANFPLERFKDNLTNNNVVFNNREWIKKVQRELNIQFGSGLNEDGYYGPNTQKANVLVKKGARGNLTKLIQEKLISIGYNIGQWGADGIFGQGTYDSIIRMQSDKHIGADGIVGPNTWRILFTS